MDVKNQNNNLNTNLTNEDFEFISQCIKDSTTIKKAEVLSEKLDFVFSNDNLSPENIMDILKKKDAKIQEEIENHKKYIELVNAKLIILKNQLGV